MADTGTVSRLLCTVALCTLAMPALAAASQSFPRAPLAMVLPSLLLILLIVSITRLANALTQRWALHRAARVAQAVGAALCAASLLTVFALGFVKPQLLPAWKRAVSSDDMAWLMAAGAAALVTLPLAWRWSYRVFFGVRDAGALRIGASRARVAALCLASLATVAATTWLRGRLPSAPVLFGMLQLAFVTSFLLTLPTALHWLGQAVRRSSGPSAPVP